MVTEDCAGTRECARGNSSITRKCAGTRECARGSIDVSLSKTHMLRLCKCLSLCADLSHDGTTGCLHMALRSVKRKCCRDGRDPLDAVVECTTGVRGIDGIRVGKDVCCVGGDAFGVCLVGITVCPGVAACAANALFTNDRIGGEKGDPVSSPGGWALGTEERASDTVECANGSSGGCGCSGSDGAAGGLEIFPAPCGWSIGGLELAPMLGRKEVFLVVVWSSFCDVFVQSSLCLVSRGLPQRASPLEV